MNTRPYKRGEVVAIGECVCGDLVVNFKELQLAAKEAEQLAAGLNLTTSQQRTWYEDTWTETVTDWSEIALLIDRIRKIAG